MSWAECKARILQEYLRWIVQLFGEHFELLRGPWVRMSTPLYYLPLVWNCHFIHTCWMTMGPVTPWALFKTGSSAAMTDISVMSEMWGIFLSESLSLTVMNLLGPQCIHLALGTEPMVPHIFSQVSNALYLGLCFTLMSMLVSPGGESFFPFCLYHLGISYSTDPIRLPSHARWP